MGKSLLVLVLKRLIRKAVRCFASPRVLVCDAITIHRIDVKVSARQHTKIPGKLLTALPKIGIFNNLHSTEKVSFWQSCQGFHGAEPFSPVAAEYFSPAAEFHTGVMRWSSAWQCVLR